MTKCRKCLMTLFDVVLIVYPLELLKYHPSSGEMGTALDSCCRYCPTVILAVGKGRFGTGQSQYCHPASSLHMPDIDSDSAVSRSSQSRPTCLMDQPPRQPKCWRVPYGPNSPAPLKSREDPTDHLAQAGLPLASQSFADTTALRQRLSSAFLLLPNNGT